MASTSVANPYPMTCDERNWLYKHHKHLVEIPTISDPKFFNSDNMMRAARYLEERLNKLGFTTRLVTIEGSAPYVLAERSSDLTAPTYLLYNHYDVQPVEPSDWDTDPFTLTTKEKAVYARGAADNKGGVMATLAMLRMAQKRGQTLPNIKILFEGEEESGSPHLLQLFEQERDFLKADAMVVMDGEDAQVLASASRGIADVTLTVNPKAAQQALSSVTSSGALEYYPSHPQRYVHITLNVRALEKPYHSGIGVLLPDCTQALAEFAVLLEKSKIVGKIHVVDMAAGQPDGGNVIQDRAECTIAIPVDSLDETGEILQTIRRYLFLQDIGKQFVWSCTPHKELYGFTPNNGSALVLAKLIHSLKKPETIEGFMEGYPGIADDEREMIRRTSQTLEEYVLGKGMLSGTELRGDPRVSIDERIVELPSLSILNMQADGRSGKAAVSIRVLAGQDPNKVAAVVARHLKEVASAHSLEITAEPHTDGAWAWKADISAPSSQEYLKSLGKGFEKARFQPCGGTNPLLAAIAQIGIPAIVPANQTSTSNAHSHNESQDLDSWEISIGCYLDFILNSARKS
ncbi:MAG: M20/M25/M40 family metallo-hydrolase [Rhabdochlamydiaceae bacterium]|nr:M20/M25/M40 family metallo-hydrolase [Rhabdochlamydiaceae bacterium]